jgi:hypothetical protein
MLFLSGYIYKEAFMNNYQIIKFIDGDFELDVNVSPEEETVWLTKNQIAALFERDRTVISRHINKVFSQQELQPAQVCAKNARQVGGQIHHTVFYNLDVIILVGYRVKSQRGLKLKQFLIDYLASLKGDYSQNNSQIIIYNNGEVSLSVNVSPEEETVYLNENQISVLFETSRQNVNLHIQNIFKEGELIENSVRKDFLHTAQDGKKYNVTFYNLDMVLAIGFRTKSRQAIEFRKWASGVLKQYMIKGYAVSDARCLECQTSILELKTKYLELEEKQNHSLLFEPGDQLKAFFAVQRFLESARKEIIIIDNYFGHAFDDILKNVNVEKTIITDPKNSKIDSCDNYKVIKISKFHDRFIIVDDYCYHFGASVGDVGKNISFGQRINEKEIINFLKRFKNS